MADFFTEFRSDHRFVLRTLMDIRKAVDAGEYARARELVEALDSAAGPHMEFEERFLYPSLAPLIGDERVNSLISDHKSAAELVQKAKEVLSKEQLSVDEVSFLHKFIQEFLQHASDCEGTALLAEALPEEKVKEFGEQLVTLRSKGKSLTVYKGVATG